jgi:hypothetical protein
VSYGVTPQMRAPLQKPGRTVAHACSSTFRAKLFHQKRIGVAAQSTRKSENLAPSSIRATVSRFAHMKRILG